ncbi:UNVERIFIED_CONTAM: putative damage-inducible protein DinB [Brevibacillus sp. OAP136]
MSRIQKATEETCALLKEIVNVTGTLSEEQIRWKPSDESWSIMEVLCHVEEAIPYWLYEMQRVIQSPGTEWGRGLQHEGRLEAVAAAPQRSVTDVRYNLQGSLPEIERILLSFTDDDLAIEAPSRNPRFGTKPMSFVVDHLVVEHLEKHLGQIKRNVESYASANQLS